MNWRAILIKYGSRLGVYIIITSLLLTVSVIIHENGPFPVNYRNDSWDHVESIELTTNLTYNVLLDSHSHTLYSDGSLTVEQNVKWHLAMGFNACVITDHNTMKNTKDVQEIALKYQDEIIVLQGMEWTTNRIHMNFLGIIEWELDILSEPTDLEFQQTIDEVHNQGGVVVANHIPWTLDRVENVPNRDQLISWGVDYIEIVNEGDFDEISLEFCTNNSLGMITATDMHSPGEIYCWTAMNITSFTAEALMDGLRVYNTSIIYDPDGATEQGIFGRNTWYILLRPFYDLGGTLSEYYLGHGKFDVPSVIVFFTYYFLTYLFLEIIIFGIRKFENRKKRDKV